MRNKLLTLVIVAFLLLSLLLASCNNKNDKISEAGDKAGSTIEKGLDATERGLNKGVNAIEKGIKKGVNAMDKAVDKLD